MDASTLLARFIGPLFVTIGLGVMLNPTQYTRMLQSFVTNSELYYFLRALPFIVGMAIILHRSLWVAD